MTDISALKAAMDDRFAEYLAAKAAYEAEIISHAPVQVGDLVRTKSNNYIYRISRVQPREWERYGIAIHGFKQLVSGEFSTNERSIWREWERIDP